jgi:hypothetical protein
MSRIFSSIERLESRIAPAVVVTMGDFDGDGSATDVLIKGGNGKERILINDGDSATTLSIDANGDGDFTDPTDEDGMALGFGATYFEISMGGGNDVVTIVQPASYTKAKSFFVNLGSGNNELHASAIASSSDLRFDVQGGKGNDFLDVHFGLVQGRVHFTGNLGPGVDGQLTGASISGPSVVDLRGLVGGGTVLIDLDLGTGSNRLRVDLDGQSPAIGSRLDVVLTGSPGAKDKDDVTIDFGTLTLPVASSASFDVDLLGGNDTFFGDFDFSGFTISNNAMSPVFAFLALDVRGGAGNDRIEVTRADTTGQVLLDGLLDLTLRGGAGNDTIIANIATAAGSAGFTSVNPQGVSRGLQLFIAAGAGNDTITTLVATNASANLFLEVSILGQSGNDTVTFTGTRNSGTVSFGPSAAVLLDGGAGTDTVTATTTGTFPLRRFS